VALPPPASGLGQLSFINMDFGATENTRSIFKTAVNYLKKYLDPVKLLT